MTYCKPVMFTVCAEQEEACAHSTAHHTRHKQNQLKEAGAENIEEIIKYEKNEQNFVYCVLCRRRTRNQHDKRILYIVCVALVHVCENEKIERKRQVGYMYMIVTACVTPVHECERNALAFHPVTPTKLTKRMKKML